MPRAKPAAGVHAQRAVIDDHLARLDANAPIRAIVSAPQVQQRLAEFEAADACALAEQARFRKWARRGLRATTFGVLVGALILLPLDAFFAGTPRRVIGALQTTALLVTFGATLLTLWLKPLDQWVRFRAEAETLRGRIFDEIMSEPAPAGSDAAEVATQRLDLLMAAHVQDQLAFFKKRSRQHGRVASHFSPIRIVGYLLIIAAGLVGGAALLHSLGLPLPPNFAALIERIVLADANRWQLGIATMASGILAHATSRALMEEDERKAALYKVTAERLQELIDDNLPATKADCAIGSETRLRQFFRDARHIMDQEHAVWTFMRPKAAARDVKA